MEPTHSPNPGRLGVILTEPLDLLNQANASNKMNTTSKEQKDSETVPVIALWGIQLKQLKACKHCTLTAQKNTFVPGFQLQAREPTALKPSVWEPGHAAGPDTCL